MPVEITAQALAVDICNTECQSMEVQGRAPTGCRELTQWYARKADDNLHGCDWVEHRLSVCLVGDKPVVRLERQSKAEQVLEDDHAGEAFDGKVACFPVC